MADSALDKNELRLMNHIVSSSPMEGRVSHSNLEDGILGIENVNLRPTVLKLIKRSLLEESDQDGSYSLTASGWETVERNRTKIMSAKPPESDWI